jgi:hypothetical protein
VSALLSQLMRFVSSNKPWCAAPFSLKVGKTSWSVGTDGFLLLAVKLAGASPRKDYPAELVTMLKAPTPENIEIDLPALQAWAGTPPTKLVPAGEVEFDHQGALLGYSIDRRKLAYLMAPMTIPTIRAWVYDQGILAFEAPDGQWRAFMSRLGSNPDPEEPVFPLATPQGKPFVIDDLFQELENS